MRRKSKTRRSNSKNKKKNKIVEIKVEKNNEACEKLKKKVQN